ncbi:Na_H_Exchanger domain-containing protein [Cephalotus follicularis]|uniref:Na_H_Exchanger domain-containing protein n=1 Tax=Cephalotus follicularis TaxID=3775 RepID=A0A1Q3C458_CEPFO|nr:Na_H_Exchanger domain-containing protein [Cephalotus follicularis]
MDATQRVVCSSKDHFNPLVTAGMQTSWILVISQIFHLVLKPLGQPGPIAQILAGLVLGPTLLSRIPAVKSFFIQPSSADYYKVSEFLCRIVFMFLIGLDLDIPYMRRNLRKASTVAYGGMIISAIFGAAISVYFIRELEIKKHKFAFAIVTMVILAYSASPVVIRLAAELKFETSEVGRLGVASSLINETSCIVLYSTYNVFVVKGSIKNGIFYLIYTVVLIFINKYLAFWFNIRNRTKKYVTNAEVLVIMFLIVALSMVVENSGFNSTLACFFLGVMFPREGKTTRTLLQKLNYAVYNFILPVYFGYTGFQFDINKISTTRKAIVVVLMILLSISGKIIGTLAACRYLKMPQNEGIVLAAMLNVKGHADLLLIQLNPLSHTWWSTEIHHLFVIVIVLNTVIAGPAVAFILKKEEKYFAHNRTSLESNDPESELRMIACVYGARSVTGSVGLISALSGSPNAPVTAYLIHLVELQKKHKSSMLYHQLEDGDQFSDEEDYGGNDVLEINEAVDAYTTDTKKLVHQVKIVSNFDNLHEDVCNSAEDFRASIIFLPFHKHQRIDGRLETGKEGIRKANSKVLRHAPCSVGLLVDRRHTGFQQPHGNELVQHVATLFFGGPDDREALACGIRIVGHPRLNLTVIRFLPSSSTKDQNSWISDASHGNEEILMAISNPEAENELDNAFVDDFYNRYVTTGQVGYVEKHVNDGAETVAALRDVGDMYSLFIVGKGGRGYSPITIGMSDWEECPELGAIGDLLASTDFDVNGSLLVIQQHRHSSKDIN